MKMKKYICLIDNLCLLGTAAFCGYHIYDHYADKAGQTEAFVDIAEIMEQAQTEGGKMFEALEDCKLQSFYEERKNIRFDNLSNFEYSAQNERRGVFAKKAA